MSAPRELDPLGQMLARLLRWGTIAATAVIASGLLAQQLNIAPAKPMLKLGLATFVLLPVARVAVMSVAFVAAREYRFALLAICVLAIIATGTFVAT